MSRPEEFQDAKRAAFLMKEFRPREANPEGYDDKMSFWIRNITRWSCQNNVILTPKSVREAFVREGIPPDNSCIKHVLNHMMHEGKIVKRNVFEQELRDRITSRSSWTSWGVSLVKKPFSWGVSYMTSSPGNQDGQEGTSMPDQEEFVNPEEVKALSESLFRQLDKKGKQVFTWNEILSVPCNLSHEVLELVILHLSAESKAVVLEDNGRKLVKIAPSNPCFTKTEVGLSRLESAQQLIEDEVTHIESQMEGLQQEARNAVKEKNQKLGLQLLRKKKRLESLLIHKNAQLENIDVLIRNLSDSDSQDAILRSYQEAAEVLKSAQKSTFVQNADKTLSSLEDALQSYNDLNLDMSRIIDPSGDFDQSDLEKELQDIVSESPSPSSSAQKEEQQTTHKTVIASSTLASNNREVSEEEFDQLLGRLERLKQPSHPLDSLDERIKERKQAAP